MKSFSIFIVILFIGSLKLFAQPFKTEAEWDEYFNKNIQSLNPIEGIWSCSNTQNFYYNYNVFSSSKYNPQAERVAIYKSGDFYQVFSITLANELKATFIRTFQATATSGIYLFDCYYFASKTRAKANAIESGEGILAFSYERPIEQNKLDYGAKYVNGMKVIIEQQWIKVSPKLTDNSAFHSGSGSGFAISSNGIIVTNYHVVEGASTIKVRGINSDFNKSYTAKVLVTDKNNDLALIQIEDAGFTSLGAIPFTIKTSLASVGENISVLGYPLRAAMGDEIKLTNGIISSKTGFQGDITSYQISAPIQPGNSGGPVFDSQGNLIGIINAKLTGAENASYAIKSSYLTGLIELLPTPPKLQTVNSLAGKTLPKQVEMVKSFVYIIEVQ